MKKNLSYERKLEFLKILLPFWGLVSIASVGGFFALIGTIKNTVYHDNAFFSFQFATVAIFSFISSFFYKKKWFHYIISGVIGGIISLVALYKAYYILSGWSQDVEIVLVMSLAASAVAGVCVCLLGIYFSSVKEISPVEELCLKRRVFLSSCGVIISFRILVIFFGFSSGNFY